MAGVDHRFLLAVPHGVPRLPRRGALRRWRAITTHRCRRGRIRRPPARPRPWSGNRTLNRRGHHAAARLASAIPSLAIGALTIEPMLFGDFFRNVTSAKTTMRWPGLAKYSTTTAAPPTWRCTPPDQRRSAGAGRRLQLAWLFYLKRPDIPAAIRKLAAPPTRCSRTSTWIICT